MLVTVTFDITTKDQKTTLEKGLYVDIEVSDEEYAKITNSLETDMFGGLYEDTNLKEICERCLKAISDWGFREKYGEDILFRLDYPLETRIDHAEIVWEAGCDEMTGSELVPPEVELYKNTDGTFTVWWPGENT